MDTAQVFLRFGVALALGLLVGMQRERASKTEAGIRTFAIVTLSGALAAAIAEDVNPWAIPIGLLCVTAIVLFGYWATLTDDDPDRGLTTAFAAIAMYLVGALTFIGLMAPAVVAGAAIAVLLQLKRPLHEFVRGMSEKDMRAVMQFVVVTLIVLPVLPDRAYDPWGVVNIRTVWLMIALVVGISLGGYLAYRWFGEKAGVLLSGVLGGAISSTATTFSVSRQAVTSRAAIGASAVIVLIASCVTYVRVLVEVGVVAPRFLGAVAWPMVISMIVLMLGAAALWVGATRSNATLEEPKNPTQLTSAVVFGALYALVLIAIEFSKQRFGTGGMYTVAIISGLTDMDAVTLSTAQLVNQQLDGATEVGVEPMLGWRIILIATMSNLVFKCGICALFGGRRFLLYVAPPFAAGLIAGALLLLLW